MNKTRKKNILVATLTMVGLSLGGLLAVSGSQNVQAADRTPTVRECRVMHNQVAKGQPISNIDLFLIGATSADSYTLSLYLGKTQFRPAIEAATKMWTERSGGKINFRFVDSMANRPVRVIDSPYSEGKALGTAYAAQRLLYLRLDRSGWLTQVSTVAHEIGHLLGLDHTCKGDLMAAGMSGVKDFKNPIGDADVALALQGLEKYLGYPAGAEPAQPTPEPTSAAPIPSQDPQPVADPTQDSQPSETAKPSEEPTSEVTESSQNPLPNVPPTAEPSQPAVSSEIAEQPGQEPSVETPQPSIEPSPTVSNPNFTEAPTPDDPPIAVPEPTTQPDEQADNSNSFVVKVRVFFVRVFSWLGGFFRAIFS
ncbi:reprolysin-like metallopeptidase [Varibaculum vaginae]|uniref:reprolysin-like metallopeptidase n=1 Tax=Varibaculum vaginae TaxID=2364797 RepID=UPI000F089BF0|nr:zinc-dependent metalloprotease family protein [Varibaculum vaginae]